MIEWRRRSFRFPGYIGAAYWSTFLIGFGFATVNSGLLWGAIFGLIFLSLLGTFLWWYGVVPRPYRVEGSATDSPHSS